jgi:hypothetical protein
VLRTLRCASTRLLLLLLLLLSLILVSHQPRTCV